MKPNSRIRIKNSLKPNTNRKIYYSLFAFKLNVLRAENLRKNETFHHVSNTDFKVVLEGKTVDINIGFITTNCKYNCDR